MFKIVIVDPTKSRRQISATQPCLFLKINTDKLRPTFTDLRFFLGKKIYEKCSQSFRFLLYCCSVRLFCMHILHKETFFCRTKLVFSEMTNTADLRMFL